MEKFTTFNIFNSPKLGVTATNSVQEINYNFREFDWWTEFRGITHHQASGVMEKSGASELNKQEDSGKIFLDNITICI